jgi:hypothetical protein
MHENKSQNFDMVVNTYCCLLNDLIFAHGKKMKHYLDEI